jgi:hypothetical protein
MQDGDASGAGAGTSYGIVILASIKAFQYSRSAAPRKDNKTL